MIHGAPTRKSIIGVSLHTIVLRVLTIVANMRILSWILCFVFASYAYAQGSLGGTQFPPCVAPQGAQYYGCYVIDPPAGGSAFYNLTIQPTSTDIRYYPGWFSANINYNSVNPANCTTACRGHGYKFSALYNGQCQCGKALNELYLSCPQISGAKALDRLISSLYGSP